MQTLGVRCVNNVSVCPQVQTLGVRYVNNASVCPQVQTLSVRCVSNTCQSPVHCWQTLSIMCMNKLGVCPPTSADTGCQMCKKCLLGPNVLIDIEHVVYKNQVSVHPQVQMLGVRCVKNTCQSPVCCWQTLSIRCMNKPGVRSAQLVDIKHQVYE